MPRIIFVFLFLILTIAPFLVVKAAEIVLNVSAPVETADTTKTTNNTTNSGYYHRPHYGGFFYFGNSGRGGWLGRSYRSSMSPSSSSGFFGKSRSYSGGSSSFKGGGFGSFGK